MEVNTKNVYLYELAEHYGIDYEKMGISVRGHIYWAEFEADEDICLLSFDTESAWSACEEFFDELNKVLGGELSVSYREIECGCDIFYVHDEQGFFPEECCVSSSGEPFEDACEDIFDTCQDAIAKWVALRDVMRNFYSPLKYREPVLRFVFLTGITKFSKVSIFSELNNITLLSMNDDYAGICGITKEELLTQMSEDIGELAEKIGITKEQAIEKLKEHYDGYHFSGESPDIFNPYSLLNCFNEKKFGSYWFASGTPTYLINMMRKFDVIPSDITRVEADASEFDAPTENMTTIMPLLYQSGYITIKDYNQEYNYYTLDIPNKEVKDIILHLNFAHRLLSRCGGTYPKRQS